MPPTPRNFSIFFRIFLGYVSWIFWIFNPRISPRDPENQIRHVFLYIPTNFHQNPTNSRQFHDPFTVQIQNFIFLKNITTLFFKKSTHFVRFQAREPAQTTSQGPNIAPKKFQGDLEIFNFSNFFRPNFFEFFDTYFDVFDVKIKDSELGTSLLSCASKFRFGWSNFQPLAL